MYLIASYPAVKLLILFDAIARLLDSACHNNALNLIFGPYSTYQMCLIWFYLRQTPRKQPCFITHTCYTHQNYDGSTLYCRHTGTHLSFISQMCYLNEIELLRSVTFFFRLYSVRVRGHINVTNKK